MSQSTIYEQFSETESILKHKNLYFITWSACRECSFKTKTLVAERAGARAVIITDITQSNEDYFIEMIDDDSTEETHIPAGFLMGKNGLMITKTLERLNMQYAIINLPVNLTFTPLHDMNQPPWLGW